jgi:hypothetical protein
MNATEDYPFITLYSFKCFKLLQSGSWSICHIRFVSLWDIVLTFCFSLLTKLISSLCAEFNLKYILFLFLWLLLP